MDIKTFTSPAYLKRVAVMVAGNIFLGMGVSLFKLSGLGNDAYDAMLMILAERIGIPFGTFFAMVSIGLFVLLLIFGRKYIGPGTIVNMLGLGYIVSFWNMVWDAVHFSPSGLWLQLPVMLIGVIFTSLGLSLYQRPQVGTSPYDSSSLILTERFPKLPYFWCRIGTDALCALITFLAGGLLGIGTICAAFGLGPIVSFFNKHLTDKLLGSVVNNSAK